MPFPPSLALASRNRGKIREILRICAAWPVQWVTFESAPADLRARWPEVEETGLTYRENALRKAREVSRVLRIPAVADDSGIEVDALDGGPGPRSARFAGPAAGEEANLRLLVERIRAYPDEARSARYRCVAACAWPDGREVIAHGKCEGRLIVEPRGTGGFGYDPVFVPDDPGDGRTMAELTPEEKDAVSHRGRAFRALQAALGTV